MFCAGSYVFAIPAEAGLAPVKEGGNFVTVFMRQSDGTWKVVIDWLLSEATMRRDT